MHVRRLAWLACALALPGCNLSRYIAENTVNEPASAAGSSHVRKRLRAEARAALADACKGKPGAAVPAFADGFVDGYVDQADNGGPPIPPAVPPPRYRRDADDQTPAGQAAARDYLAGFRQGAELAAALDRRQELLVPVALPPAPPELPVLVVRPPAPVGKGPP